MTTPSCRLCLLNDDLISLWTDQLESRDVLGKIRKYLQLEISDSDGHSTDICTICINKIEDFHSFYMKVQNNQELLTIATHVLATTDPVILNGCKGQDLNITYSFKHDDGYVIQIHGTPNPIQPPSIPNTIILRQSVIGDKSPSETDNETITYQPINYTDESIILGPNQCTEITVPVTITETIEIDNDDEDVEPEINEIESSNDGSGKWEQNKPKSIELNYFEDETDDEIECLIENEEESPNPDATVTNLEWKLNGFPTILIKDGKLIFRGRELIDLMDKFYDLSCDLCPPTRPTFKRLATLCAHYNIIHSMMGYVVCCSQKFVKQRAMAFHMARHLQPDAFTCSECKKVMTCPKILRYHQQNHLPESERPLACTSCPRRFSYSSALLAHQISHQPESERVAHVCGECGKSFISSGRLSSHMNVAHLVHTNEHVCSICDKQFSCRTNLLYHQTTHEPRVHQVECEQCGKWLKNKLCLRKHMLQHTTVRFKCDRCQYSAANRQCLRNHMRIKHTDNKPYKCDHCDKTFKLKATLISHSAQHTGEKKFACEFCARTFVSSGNYYAHRKRMHAKELAERQTKKAEEEQMFRDKLIANRKRKDLSLNK